MQPHSHPLVIDGALVLEVEPGLAPLVGGWLPVPPAAESITPSSSPSVIAVQSQPRLRPKPRTDSPTMSIGGVRAWVDPNVESVEIAGTGGASGRIDLAARRALLSPGGNSAEHDTESLYYMLTIASALLLGRIGRALVHAGAVAPHGQAAWLVVGDARAGKTTTCVNLIAAGWDYLSDDQVILTPTATQSSDSVMVEGWLRRFHLDRQWHAGQSSGERADFNPESLGAGSRTTRTSLGGILVTHVEANEPTRLGRLSEADALAAVIRQSPWLLVDPGPASSLLKWLSRVAELPRYAVSLGMDTYRDGRGLTELLQAAGRRATRKK